MLSLEQRPRTFEELAGQETIKKALMHIILDPINAPKTLLLEGAFGTGKTTTARIFARALNCTHRKPNGDACGVCEFCKSDIQDSMFYDEYDSAIVGNVNSIKELRDTFYFGIDGRFKVIVLDEIHLINKTAQSALLKVFEEPEPNVFFLLCTTDPEKLLPTIISRSFSLKFTTIQHDDIVKRLRTIVESKNMEITPDIESNLHLIADRSNGHMRNAMMLLDSMFLLKEDFMKTIEDSSPYFMSLLSISLNFNMLVAKESQTIPPDQAVAKIQGHINDIIAKLTTFTIANLKHDYEKFVVKVTKHILYDDSDKMLSSIIAPFKNTFDLINVLNDPTIYMLFKDEMQFEIAMQMLSKKLRSLKR